MNNTNQILKTAVMRYETGKLPEAEALCRQVLALDPKNADALNMLGVMAAQGGHYENAAELFTQAIRFKKSAPLFHYHLGLALKKLDRPKEALEKFKKAADLDPGYAEANLNIGNILKDEGKLEYAATKYRQAISSKPDYVEAHYNLGLVLQEQGKVAEAMMQYKRAISVKPDYAEAYLNLGVLLYQQGRLEDAVTQYRQVISFKPACADAYNHLGAVLKKQGNMTEAAALYEKAIALKPDYAEAYYNFAIILQEQRSFDDAAALYKQAIALKPGYADAHYNLGLVLQEQGKIDEALAQYEKTLALKPDSPNALSQLVHRLHHACAWDRIGNRESQLLDMVRQGREGVFPFMLLGTDSTPADQLACARAFSRKDEVPAAAQFTHTARPAHGRIRIGYLSADFYQHATAYLMAELFERHDRSRFEIVGYSYGPDDNSDMRHRLVKAFDRFVEVRGLSDRAAAQKIYDDGIDILIDLKGGYTGDARIGIPAPRPAPLQVNYLGYPGTMGVSFMDYIIADPFIVPFDQQPFYSEKIVQLPDCYQPNDTARKIADVTPSRAACGLPEKGFVFCSFNSTYKITPKIFDIWMRLLKDVPDSVLWLLECNALVKGNLRHETEKHGIAPERLVFAPRMPLPEHLARHRLADLFLDTLPINAHTTASDALWAGLPVLTCVGSTFAGRVAGSLLTSAGLPELITYSLADYETLALGLAQNPAQLLELRQRLEQTRLQMPLFDINRFVRNIESAYQTMWQTYQAGELPKAFAVAK